VSTSAPEPPWQSAAVSPAERRALGRAIRARTPRDSHAEWSPHPGRDPLGVLEEQGRSRIARLVPLRWARMASSPLAYFRGAAAVMAADLARTAVTGIDVQTSGDAHLLNFGLYASPERTLMFDLNDFDETIRGPWEWDLKRLAASAAVAGRSGGLGRADAGLAAEESVRGYRDTMARLAAMSVLDGWYLCIEAATAARNRTLRRATTQASTRATSRDHVHAYSKLTAIIDGRPRLKDRPPLVVRAEELVPADHVASIGEAIDHQRDSYMATLRPDHRLLMEHYRIVDVALKVVGTGSVGTRCFVALLEGANGHPLLMQGKEAHASVLEPFVGRAHDGHQGERVVCGQRLLQSACDALLGWATGLEGRQYYWRQLWDNKGGYDVEAMNAAELAEYAGLCGTCLAQAHARSSDAAMISGYMGTGVKLDRAISRFAQVYADQNQRDHAELLEAVRSGRIEAAIDSG
jgi:uncharacterized protein (DUF2252 family)